VNALDGLQRAGVEQVAVVADAVQRTSCTMHCGKGAPAAAIAIDTRIQGPVVIDQSPRLECIVRGPAVIGAGARLGDAHIGPYTGIDADVVPEGAEIEHSIVLPAPSICHVGTRLEASVVGPLGRGFRDFRLPNACA
jgi:NDP-sugar pyrophosphorylase family protein